MTAFDYAVVAIAVLSALAGWFRGVVGELLALAAWVVAFLGANALSPWVMPWLPRSVGVAELRVGGAWLLVFVGILVLFALGRMLIRALLKAAGLGGLDRLLGAGFGILRGVVVVLVLVLAAGLTPLPASGWWREAALSPPLETAVIAAKPWLPQALAARIRYR